MSFEMTNFYEKCDDDTNEVYRYPNEDQIKIKLPMRAVVLGPSGTGKTNLAVNLIPAIGIWKKIIILAKNLDQPLYHFVTKRIAEIKKEEKIEIELLKIDNIKDMPPIDSFSPKVNTLLIVDDFVADDPKSLIPLNEIWMRGRGKGISPVFISQSYYDTPKMIRKNSDYLLVKELGNPLDLSRIAREYALGCTAKEIAAKYEKTVDGDFKSFFLVDRFNRDMALKFRHKFAPIKE